MAPSKNELFEFEMTDGRTKTTDFSFYRGDVTNFHPDTQSMDDVSFIPEFVVKGLVPKVPFIDKNTRIVSFGSCFASNVRRYLKQAGYKMPQSGSTAYIHGMGDGIVNSFSLLQQFEWAWRNKVPKVELWHGYDAEAFGYDENVRLATKKLFDNADVFIVTFGLSEIWYDQATEEVFWRAVPKHVFDPTRHKFRVATHRENHENIAAMYRLIRQHRPEAAIIFTLSPIALTATFRNQSCIVSSAASKANLRSALDEFHRDTADDCLFYFPSYEIALHCFDNALKEDRKHIRPEVIQFIMAVFERYFCASSLTDEAIANQFKNTREALKADASPNAAASS